LPTTCFEDETHELRAPCRILLHTDGLIESHGEERLLMGQERLERWMKESLLRDRSAEQLRDELAAELARTREGSQPGRSLRPLVDDQTFLIVAEQQFDDAGNG
jgi:hypothetical protein